MNDKMIKIIYGLLMAAIVLFCVMVGITVSCTRAFAFPDLAAGRLDVKDNPSETVELIDSARGMTLVRRERSVDLNVGQDRKIEIGLADARPEPIEATVIDGGVTVQTTVPSSVRSVRFALVPTGIELVDPNGEWLDANGDRYVLRRDLLRVYDELGNDYEFVTSQIVDGILTMTVLGEIEGDSLTYDPTIIYSGVPEGNYTIRDIRWGDTDTLWIADFLRLHEGYWDSNCDTLIVSDGMSSNGMSSADDDGVWIGENYCFWSGSDYTPIYQYPRCVAVALDDTSGVISVDNQSQLGYSTYGESADGYSFGTTDYIMWTDRDNNVTLLSSADGFVGETSVGNVVRPVGTFVSEDGVVFRNSSTQIYVFNNPTTVDNSGDTMIYPHTTGGLTATYGAPASGLSIVSYDGDSYVMVGISMGISFFKYQTVYDASPDSFHIIQYGESVPEIYNQLSGITTITNLISSDPNYVGETPDSFYVIDDTGLTMFSKTDFSDSIRYDSTPASPIKLGHPAGHNIFRVAVITDENNITKFAISYSSGLTVDVVQFVSSSGESPPDTVSFDGPFTLTIDEDGVGETTLVASTSGGADYTFNVLSGSFNYCSATIAGTNVLQCTGTFNLYGEDTVLIEVTLGTETDSGIITVTIASVADTPYFINYEIGPYEINEDSPATTFSLVAEGGDPDGDTANLSWSIFTSIAETSPFAASITNDSFVTITPEADENGMDTIHLRLTSSNGYYADTILQITVIPMNDSPTLLPIPNISMDTNSEDSIVLSAYVTHGDDSSLTFTVTNDSGYAHFTATLGGTDVLNITAGDTIVSAGEVTVTVGDGDAGDTVSQVVLVYISVPSILGVDLRRIITPYEISPYMITPYRIEEVVP